MSDAMNAPVTRAELREELATEVAKLATKAELQEEVAKLATKAELREEVAKLATKAELREEVAKLATKAELHSALEIWAGALREELKADAQQREERMTATITATTTATITAATASMTATITANIAEHVSTELARHVGAFKEHTQTQISVIDDKYQDVPPRLANVEALAHTHPEPPSKKVTGRRSR